MENILSFPSRKNETPGPFASLLAIVAVTILVVLITQQYYAKEQDIPLINQLQSEVGIAAPTEIYEAAIAYAAKNLAVELDIELENYDITEEAYEALLEAAATKFGNCHQYRLYALAPNLYPCYTCVSKPRVVLNYGQTFKIGQTCGSQKSRYGSTLPEPGLKYFIEFEGSVFEVLVAEYVKLILFRSSLERKEMIESNHLSDMEMLLPPGNKILK